MRHEGYLILFAILTRKSIAQKVPEVKIDQGRVSGQMSIFGAFYEYVGVPYASTNESTRFQPPLPAPTWEGVYKATEEVLCAQVLPILPVVSGKEDCLRVNIYVPIAAAKPLPVMVFIHGGGFMTGTSGQMLYRPELLLAKEVIVVTVNYRLGVLGFLCLGIKEAPGNAGLRDQIAALKWVKKNIAAFGGDPDNITVFGESAGGASIAIFLSGNLTEGLFKRAILQSGTGTAIWAINRTPIETAKVTIKALHYKAKDPRKIYEILSKVPYKTLVGTDAPDIFDVFFHPEKVHSPCIENHIDGIEPILADYPYNLIKDKPINIPLIYGSNNREGLFLLTKTLCHTPLEDRKEKLLFGSDLDFESAKEKNYVTKRVKEFYYGNKSPKNNNFNNAVDLYTHLNFEMPAILESEMILKNTNSSFYNYYFKYSGLRNAYKFITGYENEPGACHADELLYLFNAYLMPLRLKEEQVMVNWMTTMWTNFAKYGDPTPNPSDDLPVKWLSSTKDNLKLLYIDKELKMGPIPNPEAYQLWKDIYSKYRKTRL